MGSFIASLNQGMISSPDANVFSSIWNEYEKVIVQSLLTSFGLDFLVQDQHGGDVDTIHNVREIGKDLEMRYKNSQNQKNYENRGEYQSSAYHKDPRYIEINRKVSERKKKGTLIDSYTGKNVARNADVDLDHAVAAKEVHEDAGRILAGLDGIDLANASENLKPTDKSINRSMQQKDMNEYLEKWEKDRPVRQERIKKLKSKGTLTEKERKELNKLEKLEEINPDKMQAEYNKARADYEGKIAKAYYTSPKFAKDAAFAAGKRGAEMGIRQATGLVFMEIWFAVKIKLQTMPPHCNLEDILQIVTEGVKDGVHNTKIKYKEIIEKVEEGFTAGFLASLTTTLCNIFFTMSKSLVRNIRQIYASVVQAGKVLLFNPDELLFGDRIKTATIILATGASVLIGKGVETFVENSLISKLPVVGNIIPVFCATLVSGLLSCTLLIFLDRSSFMNKIVSGLNEIPSEVNNYQDIADAMEWLAAKIEDIDIEKFRTDTGKYNEIAANMEIAENEEELNAILLSAYKFFHIQMPWQGEFDTFMGERTNRLVFE